MCPMEKRFSFAYSFLPLLLLVALTACRREPLPVDEGSEGTVMLSAETKALPAGVNTFRVALFTPSNRMYSGREGTYCTETFTHTDNYSSTTPVNYEWLQPCRVNDNGDPLKSDGSLLTGSETLADADHSSSYGLRWNNGGSSWSGSIELVAIAPARAFVAPVVDPLNPPSPLDGSAYLNWSIDDEVYISDPVECSFSGIWVNGKYVYNSLTSGLSSTLTDHRAKVSVKIQCTTDLISSTNLYGVWITNRIVSDRFYLHAHGDNVQGFSRPSDPSNVSVIQHFTLDNDPAHYSYMTNTAGLPDHTDHEGKSFHIQKEPQVDWSSASPVYLQARDYSVQLMTGKRPEIVVELGQNVTNTVIVRVPLAQNLKPMHHYIYILDVTNAYVSVHLAQTSWDTVAGGTAITETPAYLGTVEIGGPNTGDDDWGNGGGGTADKPVNS